MLRLRSTSPVLALSLALPLAAQQPDSTRRDTSVVELAPIEVVGSIAPTAGASIG